MELGKAAVSEMFVAAVDRALDAGGQLLALYPAVVMERTRARQGRSAERREALRSAQEVDDVKRRAFLGLGLSVVLLGPEAAAHASDEEWDRIAHAWSYELQAAPDRRALLPGLAADLRRLQANGGPRRVVAQLASYVGTIAMSDGDPALAKRWWWRARVAAAGTGDPQLVSYVTGRQAVQGLYGAYAPAQILALADEALSASTTPSTGRMEALSAKAQALSMLGRDKAAGDALAGLERTFEQLPGDVSRAKVTALGFAEERMHHVRSYCAVYGGEGGEAARDEALRLYSDVDWRGRAQVTLHRAASERDAGLALDALAALEDAQRSDRFVRMIAAQALASCEARNVARTAELREALA